MDSDGATYLLDMDESVFAPLAKTNEQLLEALLDGRNGRVDSYELLNGRLTGRTLRAGTERECWGLEHFSNMAPFLPAKSWEPARRPPTVLAMVRTAEDLLRKTPASRESPKDVMVTCGGFIRDINGQLYFVPHTENAIWTRRAAGFKVSPPPPGLENIPTSPGGMIAYVPPASWSQ
jgi:hypothetical protein